MTTITSSSPSPSPVDVSDNGPRAQRSKQPLTLYSMVMTPVNLVVFLLSLALVDLRYTLARTSNNRGGAGDAASGLLPRWLLRWLPALLTQRLDRLVSSLRGQPYRDSRDASGRWYYHSKQKKLIKMEADEAFRLRGIVMTVLAVLAVAVTMVFYYVASRAYHALVILNPALS
ncbi:hypothetical protein BGZ61DRAFT_526474 [Ilyonectria robusta]|uniref:uncharacterized protein n=1 Tax=Ilyonectria robusta TaxID=1079257 RepID=UPI001E8EE7B5|nr:uncharacterized protein BGZ61DRAFT_526474 [Ilyonectria robusta]KAH8735376.1 hypothetical protein BGZ61DRAFT_526474 [Ilyonectria robusta]